MQESATLADVEMEFMEVSEIHSLQQGNCSSFGWEQPVEMGWSEVCEAAVAHIEIAVGAEGFHIGSDTDDGQQGDKESNVIIGHRTIGLIESSYRFDKEAPKREIFLMGAKQFVEKIGEEKGHSTFCGVEIDVSPGVGSGDMAQKVEIL